jgi:sugar phosphate isomerase/epimerase
MRAAGNRLGFSTLGCPGWSLADALRHGEELGFDAIELRLLDGRPVESDLADSEIDRVSGLLASSVLDITSLATSVRLFDREVVERQLPRFVRMAEAWGAPWIRVFSGPVPEGKTLRQSLDVLAESLALVLPAARAAGVGIALETHHDLSGAGEVARAMALVDDPLFAVIWDVMHTFAAGDTADSAWAGLGARTVEIQIKDARLGPSGEWRPTLLDEGELPWRSSLRRALDDGFSGPIVLEWEKQWHPEIEEPEIALPHDLALVREVLSEGQGTQ